MARYRTSYLIIIVVIMISFIAGCSLTADANTGATEIADITSGDADCGTPNIIPMAEGRSMTLSDVLAIAQNIGPSLTMEDLREYTVDLLDEGLYGYRVVGGLAPYNLIVATDDMQNVIYTKFYDALCGGVLGDTSEAIDIRYYDVEKFIADGTQELIRPLPESEKINDINIVGTWISATGSVTNFYEDGTGKTEVDDGIYGFSWRVVSLTEAAADSLRGYRVLEYYRVLSDTPEGIHWGGNVDVPMTDGWSAEGYIIVLTFDGIDIPFDYALIIDGLDKLVLNTGPLGESLAPIPNLENRLQWVVFERAS